MTQEEYMDVLGMRSQGWTIAEIARETNYHPATVSKWLKEGGPPPARTADPALLVVDQRWGSRIAELVEPPSRLLSTSVYEIITAEGFSGSYPSVVRKVRALRGPRFRPAPQVSVPIETAPGEESQFDFSDCSARGRAWGLGEILWCFGAVACWSRFLTWWWTPGYPKPHHVGGLIHRAYLLKEQFRLVFQLRGKAAIGALEDWCAWARRCRIPAFVDLSYRVVKHRESIVATLTNDGLSNALAESTNTKLRLLTRVAYGFRSTDNLIALCMLDRGGYCPPLPGRHAA